MDILPRLLPRTRTTGRCPRGAQVRPFGGLSPWPASSSKQIQAFRAAAVLLPGATPPPSTPRPPRRRAPARGEPAPARTSRAGASASTRPAPCTRHGKAGRSACGSGPASSAGPHPSRAPAGHVRAPAPTLPTPRAQPLHRVRPLRAQRLRTALTPCLAPLLHLPRADPQLSGDITGLLTAREPLRRVQPPSLPRLFTLRGQPTTLRIPHKHGIPQGSRTVSPSRHYEFNLSVSGSDDPSSQGVRSAGRGESPGCGSRVPVPR